MNANHSFLPAFPSKAAGRMLIPDFSGKQLLLAAHPKDEATYYINQSCVQNLVDLSKEVAEFRRMMIQIASETELYVQDGKFVSNNPNLITFLRDRYGVKETIPQKTFRLLKKIKTFFS